MTRNALLRGLLLLGLFTVALADAKPISPNPGEGKYRFCQRMYDACMTGVFGSPGSQSYNVGRARCYSKWTHCRKTSTWNTVSAIERYNDGESDISNDLLEAEEALE